VLTVKITSKFANKDNIALIGVTQTWFTLTAHNSVILTVTSL